MSYVKKRVAVYMSVLMVLSTVFSVIPYAETSAEQLYTEDATDGTANSETREELYADKKEYVDNESVWSYSINDDNVSCSITGWKSNSDAESLTSR